MRKPLAYLISSAVAAIAVTADAQTIDQTIVVDRILTEVIEEQRLFNTCGATLDPRSVELIDKHWQDMATETLDWLKLNGLNSETISEFAQLTTAFSIRLPDQTPFGEVISYCKANPEWMRKMAKFEMIQIPAAIITALAENQ